MEYHIPVLLEEVLNILGPQPGRVIIDATLGHGGHSLALLKAGATVYGIDQDPSSIKAAIKRFQDEHVSSNFIPIQGNFSDLDSIFSENIQHPVDGILIDLGLNSSQQKSTGRGFSFNDDQSIDMRLDPVSQTETAENIINTYDFQQLYNIFTKYAQETLSKPLIIRIIEERQRSPIKTGKRLADIIRKYYQEKHIHTSIDPATKIFMALRIAVNHEFEHLRNILGITKKILKSGGVVCVISFHSGEDRIVKNFIQKERALGSILVASKGVSASYGETRTNPLSRSAILRSYRIN